ncbi:hypothetical protein CANCADRAFT_2795 [Tortispora caseinolytica NRRL Y-17796]|uniref:mitogen-activated protein kinase kinase n=1 Tax=Tortispora caseinolytica NRRL Y-17796 TaxID=767744 RepID=A0A1E4TH74_9ASCO|nr:hypothetical protein CANCADRAFT_2795 [Tortispora caseinolytica NRRL Y-17796]
MAESVRNESIPALKPRSLLRKNVKQLVLPGENVGADSAKESSPSVSSERSQYAVELQPRRPTAQCVDSPRSDLDAAQLSIDGSPLLRSEDFKSLSELGAGAGGSVNKVLHRPSRKIMARKMIRIEAKATVSKQIVRELYIMKECKTDYIVSFFGAFVLENSVVMCMEYMDCGSLDRIYKLAGRIEERPLQHITYSVLNGLTYLYTSHRIMHRDVKPSNILVNCRGQIKLCDFGVSGELINSVADTFVGTSTYMSPERIQGAPYTVKSDVWSFGLTLLELSMGKSPFCSKDDSSSSSSTAGPLGILDLLQQIVNESPPKLPENSGYSKELQSCINACLIKDVELRPSPWDLLKHPFAMNLDRSPGFDMARWARQFAFND